MEWIARWAGVPEITPVSSGQEGGASEYRKRRAVRATAHSQIYRGRVSSWSMATAEEDVQKARQGSRHGEKISEAAHLSSTTVSEILGLGSGWGAPSPPSRPSSGAHS